MAPVLLRAGVTRAGERVVGQCYHEAIARLPALDARCLRAPVEKKLHDLGGHVAVLDDGRGAILPAGGSLIGSKPTPAMPTEASRAGRTASRSTVTQAFSRDPCFPKP
jgi:hypothetical protein